MNSRHYSDNFLHRKDVIDKFSWVSEKNRCFIVSADYDGLICAVYLHHTLNWHLTGFYDLCNIWISDEGIKNRENLIWVDLNILPRMGKAVGGHIISLDGEYPSGFNSSCNPNILFKLSSNDFQRKYPFSTLLFLFWLHRYLPRMNDLARMLILNSDASWLKYQTYHENSRWWMTNLTDYPWEKLFRNVNTTKFEERMNRVFIPLLKETGAAMKKGKLSGKFKQFSSYQIQINPDWDTDVINRLFLLIGNATGWTPPELPRIGKVFEGKRYKIPLSQVINKNLNTFLKKKKVFSYAITSSKTFNFTTFNSAKTPVKEK